MPRVPPPMRIQQGAWRGMPLVAPTKPARARASREQAGQASQLAGTTSRRAGWGWFQSGTHPTAAPGVRRAQTLSQEAANAAAAGKGSRK